MRFSWENDILTRFSHELFYWWESHFSHERWKLMRVSWDSHEKTLSRKICFCFFSWLYRVIPSIRKFLIENVVSWVFSISRESKYSMHARCVSERKPFRGSFFFWTKHVHLSRDEVVRTGTCTCTCNVAKNQLCNDWSSYRLWSWSDRSNRTIVHRSFCGLRLRSFQVRF